MTRKTGAETWDNFEFIFELFELFEFELNYVCRVFLFSFSTTTTTTTYAFARSRSFGFHRWIRSVSKTKKRRLVVTRHWLNGGYLSLKWRGRKIRANICLASRELHAHSRWTPVFLKIQHEETEQWVEGGHPVRERASDAMRCCDMVKQLVDKWSALACGWPWPGRSVGIMLLAAVLAESICATMIQVRPSNKRYALDGDIITG